jgi:signal transduction histidine kinase/ActR/RegA family two-component response regulator
MGPAGTSPESDVGAYAETRARHSALVVGALVGAIGVACLLLPDALLDVGSGLLLRDVLFLLIASALVVALVRRILRPASADGGGAAPAPPAAGETERLLALGRASANAAHDLNNVLTAIGGYAELALGRASADESTRQDLVSIQRSADRGARLAQRLLRGGTESQPEVLDLNAVLMDLGRVLPHLMGGHVQVSVEPASRPARIVADLSELEQVVLNLAFNARAALAEGGRLLIQAGILDLPGEPQRVELLVFDDGRGMDAATRERAFEPGFSTRPGGTGLGLPAVAAIVRRAGGSISCDSSPGQGTSVRLLLPLAEPASHGESGTAPATVAVPPAPRLMVLVVDDDAAVCGVVSRMLQDGGHTTLTARNGNQAFEMVARGGIDLVLCDMLMPEKEGLETITSLREHWPALPIIAMSGALRGDSYMGMARKFGAVETLRKPFGREALLAAVAAAAQAAEITRHEEAGTA